MTAEDSVPRLTGPARANDGISDWGDRSCIDVCERFQKEAWILRERTEDARLRGPARANDCIGDWGDRRCIEVCERFRKEAWILRKRTEDVRLWVCECSDMRHQRTDNARLQCNVPGRSAGQALRPGVVKEAHLKDSTAAQTAREQLTALESSSDFRYFLDSLPVFWPSFMQLQLLSDDNITFELSDAFFSYWNFRQSSQFVHSFSDTYNSRNENKILHTFLKLYRLPTSI